MTNKSAQLKKQILGIEELVEEWGRNGIPKLSSPSTLSVGCHIHGCRTMAFVDFQADIRREQLCYRHFKEATERLKSLK